MSSKLSSKPYYHDLSHISPLPPSHYLEESEDDGAYGAARDVSDLNIKYQDDEDDEEYYEQYESFRPPQQGPRHQQQMTQMPLALVQDLAMMLQDYRTRFPAPAPPVLPPPDAIPGTPPRPQVPPVPAVTPVPVEPDTLLPPQVHTDDDNDEEDNDAEEEGELPQSPVPMNEWEDYIAPSPPSPTQPPTESPPVDIGGFHAIMERATSRFHLNMETTQTDCFLYDFKEQAKKSTRSIPIIDHIWEEGVHIMKTPFSVSPLLPRVDKKYKAPSNAPACLSGHPKADSVISQAAQRSSRNPSAPLSAPTDREGRRLDGIGKRFTTTAGASVRASNALAILARYDRQLWSDIASYLDMLPEDKIQEARKILAEGERSASEIIDISMDIASLGFRQLAGAAVLRRQGWLKSTNFRPEVQSKILDMPFDGDSLFGRHVDEALQELKKDTDTAKALGTLQYRKVPFRGARGRGSYSFRGASQRYSSQNYQGRYTYQQQQQQSYRAPPQAAYRQNRRRQPQQRKDTSRTK